MGISESILVWRLRRGDPDSCRELIRRHHQGIYAYLRRRGADPSLAEDLTQETYAKAWRRIGTLRQATSLRSWLLSIARNEFLQWARGQGTEQPAPESWLDGPDIDRGAEAAVLRMERNRRLHRAVERLDPMLKEAVALHYYQDLSLRETAAVLEVPVGTVKSRLNRALNGLRALLDAKEADHEEQRAEEALAGRS